MTKRHRIIHETDVAGAVVNWLQDDGWKVYQEVSTGYAYQIADIVAVKEELIWIIECKTTMSLQLLGQALHWSDRNRWCNLISVATPNIDGRRRPICPASLLLKHEGIGHLIVEPRHDYAVNAKYFTVEERIASVNRISDCKIKDKLVEAQQTYAAAGNNKGRRWTPFQQTCDDLRAKIVESPGISLKSAVASIKTHYSSESSARSNLFKLIRCGIIKGVRIETEGRVSLLYPKPEEALP